MENLENRILSTQTLQDKAKKFIDEFKILVNNKKLNWKIMIWIGILWFLVLVYMVVNLLLVISNLNSKTKLLLNLETYDTRVVQSNQFAKSMVDKNWKISDIIKIHSDFKSEIGKYQEYISNLNIPYQYFLQYVYLPHLNIWKNIYTDEIDVNMVWKNFLENNPYNDIFLLQKRSDFFKNVWDNNESNDIKNIRIWDITENTNWLFSIPVSLSFESKSKRAFLLLVDKVSVTSNKATLSLINEFFYYMWQEIKSDNKSEIASLKKEYSVKYPNDKDVTDDKVIWFYLYNWIYFNEENKLISQKIIDTTIRKVAYCEKEWNEMCYYKFREKYRDIPTFWYLIWWINTYTNSVEGFKKFILSLPPIFSVKQFNFNQVESSDNASSNRKYKWSITIDIYGKWLSQWELDEISKKLWEVCYSNKWSKYLSVENALESINKSIESLSDIEKNDTADSSDLWQLKNIVEEISKGYNGYTNYKKIVKLFEIYRMLKNVWLCR